MKKHLITLMLILAGAVVCLFISSCATTSAVCTCLCGCGSCGCVKPDGNATIAYITSKEWKLIEVRAEDTFLRETLFDRNTLSKEAAGDVFILKVTNDFVSGKAAPNTYTAQYTANERDKTISVKEMVVTELPPVWQPLKIKEQDYYTYLKNAYKWDVANGRLLLYSKAENGRDILLTYQ